MPPITTTQVCTGTGSSVPPISIGSQKIEGPRRSVIPQEVRNSKPLDDSINRNPDKHSDPTPSCSKVIFSKKITNEIANVYACGRMNFGSYTVLSESSNFMGFGLSSVNTTDKLGSVFIPTTRNRRPTDGSNWILPGHDISEATVDRVSGKKAKNHYNFKSEFETRRDNILDQYFGRQSNPISRPTLDLTPFGMNTTNRTTSPIDSILVRTKTPEPTPLTLPT